MALAPAETTSTGVRASSCRSADRSKVAEAPRCTPADAPGGEHGDAGQVSGQHGAAHGSGRVQAAAQDPGQVPPGSLPDPGGGAQVLDLLRVPGPRAGGRR